MTSATLTPETRTAPAAPQRRIRSPRSRRARRVLGWIAEHAVLIVLAVLFVSPVIFVFLTSVMSSSQTLTASLWPQPFVWSNYVTVFTTVPLAQWFANSAMYAILATAFMLVSPVPAGSSVHARSRLLAAEAKPKGTQLTQEIHIHVVGNDRPALTYEMLTLYHPKLQR